MLSSIKNKYQENEEIDCEEYGMFFMIHSYSIEDPNNDSISPCQGCYNHTKYVVKDNVNIFLLDIKSQKVNKSQQYAVAL